MAWCGRHEAAAQAVAGVGGGRIDRARCAPALAPHHPRRWVWGHPAWPPPASLHRLGGLRGEARQAGIVRGPWRTSGPLPLPGRSCCAGSARAARPSRSGPPCDTNSGRRRALPCPVPWLRADCDPRPIRRLGKIPAAPPARTTERISEAEGEPRPGGRTPLPRSRAHR